MLTRFPWQSEPWRGRKWTTLTGTTSGSAGSILNYACYHSCFQTGGCQMLDSSVTSKLKLIYKKQKHFGSKNTTDSPAGQQPGVGAQRCTWGFGLLPKGFYRPLYSGMFMSCCLDLCFSPPPHHRLGACSSLVSLSGVCWCGPRLAGWGGITRRSGQKAIETYFFIFIFVFNIDLKIYILD